MNMEYRLLNGETGVILTREPEIISDNLYISFTGAPEQATAIFEREDGESAYRELSAGLCGLNKEFLQGTIKVTVALLNGSIKPKRWFCEGINARPQKDGRVLVRPDDLDMQRKIVALQVENSELKAAICEQAEKYSELEKKLNKLLEGYDIV